MRWRVRFVCRDKQGSTKELVGDWSIEASPLARESTLRKLVEAALVTWKFFASADKDTAFAKRHHLTFVIWRHRQTIFVQFGFCGDMPRTFRTKSLIEFVAPSDLSKYLRVVAAIVTGTAVVTIPIFAYHSTKPSSSFVSPRTVEPSVSILSLCSRYENVWTTHHPFEFAGYSGVPRSVRCVVVPERGGETRDFLLVELPEQTLAFLLNPHDEPSIVEDINTSFREWELTAPVDMQIVSSNISKSCVHVVLRQTDVFIKFLLSREECGLIAKGKCGGLDSLMLLVFGLLRTLQKLHMTLLLDDDAQKNGQSILLFRFAKGTIPPSKYQEYGFKFADPEHMANLLQQWKTKKTERTSLEKQIKSAARSMYNSDVAGSAELLCKKCM